MGEVHMFKNEFALTKDIFSEYVDYHDPLSYDEWVAIPNDHKAAVLFCQFYDQITLAWYKLVSDYVSEADGIEEIMQYLNKNVTKILQDPNRFTPAYIYTVCYNCLYCLCQKDNKHRHHYSMNSYVLNDDRNVEESKNTNFSCDGGINDSERDAQRTKLWDLIESHGHDAVVVVSDILGETVDWSNFKLERNKPRCFTQWDIKRISEDRRNEILESLRRDILKLKVMDELDLIF